MRLYSEYLLPRVYDWLMDRPFLRERRREQLTSASGNVLEIGIGTGLNLPHYPRSITEITAVDPNLGMNAMLQRRLRTVDLRVHLHPVSGERLPFADESFDCVVSTLVLCSIPDVERVVAEVYRVLKPNGRYLFLEHGRVAVTSHY
ncbi:MAG: class I SAM-dependent methyltransferase [Pirellulaceae bacterium]